MVNLMKGLEAQLSQFTEMMNDCRLSEDRKKEIQDHLKRIDVWVSKTEERMYPTEELSAIAERQRERQLTLAGAMRKALEINSEYPLDSVGDPFKILLSTIADEASELDSWASYIKANAPSDQISQMQSRAREWVTAMEEDLDAQGLSLGPTSNRQIAMMMKRFDSEEERENAARTIVGSLLTEDAKSISEYEEEIASMKTAAESMITLQHRFSGVGDDSDPGSCATQ